MLCSRWVRLTLLHLSYQVSRLITVIM